MSSSDYADIDEKNDDYASLSSRSNEIDRSAIDLGDILGVGQFGDVFKGWYDSGSGKPLEVAIKTCKLLADEDDMAKKLLEEAYIMEQFDHPHIIQIYGVCSESPVWIVMEFAVLGEMRAFLHDNKPTLGLDKLTLYCYQLSSALSYLESKSVVHRDIAARNVLVATEDCVKLADFGLSRWVEEQNYYKAAKGQKMPVKWMAPESINYRRFTTASDVWMFGVCMWEILSYGVKPFPDIENKDVIDKLESGERLAQPVGCSISLYSVMSSCWFYQPGERPHFSAIKTRLRDILLDEHKDGATLLNKHRAMPYSAAGMPDRAPPKPIRPGFSVSMPSLLEDNQRTEATVPSGYWETASSMAAIRTEDKLQRQRKQIAEDTVWLQTEESNRTASRPTRFNTEIVTDFSGRQPTVPLLNNNQVTPDDKKTRLTRKMSSTTSPSEPEISAELLESIEIDRSNDEVFKSTMRVISSVVEMTNTVNDKNARLFVPLTKNIGESLKVLQASVDSLIDSLPHANKVKMAQKVLNSEMASLVNAMKLALKYVNTVNLDVKYRREMLQAAHVIAVDSRNLLDTVDMARRVQIYVQQTSDQHRPHITETQYSQNTPAVETENSAEQLSDTNTISSGD